MGVFVRPRVAELVFRLYDRPLHPELFEPLATRVVKRERFRLSTSITRTGHVIEWVSGTSRLTEVTATEDQELPACGRRVAHRFGGGRSGRCELAGCIRYQVSSQVEVLTPEAFVHQHEELRVDGAKKGLLFDFHAGHRLSLPPFGVVIIEALADALSVAAFHTFPDELAIIKTQSLIEWC